MRSAAILLLAAAALGCSLQPVAPAERREDARALSAAAPARPAAPALVPGIPVEGEIGPGETRGYDLALAAGQYLRVSLQRKAGQVALSLTGPDGARLAEAGQGPREDQGILSVVSPVAGFCRLFVTSPATRPGSASYVLRIAELRPAGPGDEERVAAQRAFAAALRARDHERGETSAVLRDLEAALRLWQATGDAQGETDAWNEIGLTRAGAGEISEAIAAYEQALTTARRGGYTWGEAAAFNNLGLVQDNARETARYFEQAIELWQQDGARSEVGTALYSLAWVHYNDLGEVETALDFAERALAILDTLGNSINEARTRTLLGLIYRRLGEGERALGFFRQALELARESGDGRSEAVALANMAVTQWRRGKLQEALDLFDQALERNRRVGNRPGEASVLQQRGSLYVTLGDRARALADYRRALDLHQAAENLAWEASTLNSIGRLERETGRPDRALTHHAKALEIGRRAENQRVEAEALYGIGVAYLAAGDPERGLSHLDGALALWRKVQDRHGQAQTLLEIAAGEQALGRAEALERHGQALDLARQVEDQALLGACLLRRARLLRDRGDLQASRADAESALELVESARGRVASQNLRASYFATKRSYSELYVDLLLRLEESRPGEGFGAAAFQASESARARVLLELIAEGRIDVREGIAAELKQREERLGERLAWTQVQLLENLASPSPREEKTAALRRELAGVEQEREKLEAEIRTRHPRYAEVLYPEPLRLAQAQSLLDADTALLEYSLGSERSVLFVVTREGLTIHRLPPAGEIAGRVLDLRETLRRPRADLAGRYVELASSLYQELLAPAASVLAGKRKLLIAPDGALALLPFEALLSDRRASQGRSFAGLPYLIRTHAVAYVPSASVLASLRSPGRPAAGPSAVLQFVAFADPVLEDGARTAAGKGEPPVRSAEPWSRDLPPLPQTRREVDGIARLYPPGETAVFLQEEACEENVKEGALASARRIHFATHGVLDEELPQLSGLVLTRRPGSREDGVLRVFEIFNLRLSADLVVLSACETGLGKQVTGEGLIGLARGFLYAGASSLVVSLWRVADDSTPGLMLDFYRHLDRGDEKSEALRRAKLAMIDGGTGAHPSLWAPFILMGEPI